MKLFCISTASGTSAPTMNYRQLEEAINKWTIELEEQEKIFLQQATQVNAWDRLLIDNGEKVRSPLNIGYFNFRSKHFGYSTMLQNGPRPILFSFYTFLDIRPPTQLRN